MSRRSSRRAAAADAFPSLSEGVQKGLKRLVTDNTKVIAKMLDVSMDKDDANDATTTISKLCEKCAQVMKQQQLTASSFLARFFHTDILADHASNVLYKSAKGSAATLADRIAAEWAKNKAFPDPSSSPKDETVKDDDLKQEEQGNEKPSSPKKRKHESNDDAADPKGSKQPKKDKATKATKKSNESAPTWLLLVGDGCTVHALKTFPGRASIKNLGWLIYKCSKGLPSVLGV